VWKVGVGWRDSGGGVGGKAGEGQADNVNNQSVV